MINISEVSAQVVGYKKYYFNQCIANRNVTRENEKYQVAYCNDQVDLYLNSLRIDALEKLEEAKKLLIIAEEYKDISTRDFTGEGDIAPNVIKSFNRLNNYENPFINVEFRTVKRLVYQKLQPLSHELIRIKRIKAALETTKSTRCEQEHKTGAFSNECMGFEDYAWYNMFDESMLTMSFPR